MARSIRVTADKLAQAIDEILNEYGEEVRENSDAVTRAVAKKGVQALRSASSVYSGTKYRSGWGVDLEVTRYNVTAHIWNKKVPGLPHLLEYSHALRNGKRSVPRVHIQPVADNLVHEYQRQLEKKL